MSLTVRGGYLPSTDLRLVVSHDSRCVIGTPTYQDTVVETDTNPFKHIVSASQSIFPIQLTIDHKPNVEAENRRLRTELAEAENKLEAITSIELAIREQDQTPD